MITIINAIAAVAVSVSTPGANQPAQGPATVENVPTVQEIASMFCDQMQPFVWESKADSITVDYCGDTLGVNVYVNERQFAKGVDVPEIIGNAKYDTRFYYEMKTAGQDRLFALLLALASAVGGAYALGKGGYRILRNRDEMGTKDKMIAIAPAVACAVFSMACSLAYVRMETPREKQTIHNLNAAFKNVDWDLIVVHPPKNKDKGFDKGLKKSPKRRQEPTMYREAFPIIRNTRYAKSFKPYRARSRV